MIRVLVASGSAVGRAGLQTIIAADDSIEVVRRSASLATLTQEIEEVQPDVHVNGSEYGCDCVEAPTVRQFGGRVHLVERVADLSTSAIVAALRMETRSSAQPVHVGRSSSRGAGFEAER